MKSSEVGLFEL